MRVIPAQQVVMAPQRCAVVPTLGPMCRHRFIDTGQDIPASPNIPQRVYVSEPGVLEMARKFGWTVLTPDDVTAADARVAELEQRIVDVEAAKAELEQRFGAIDVLASAGFVARKKPGRPVNEKAVA